jgi:hypothetical protein
VAKEMGRLKSNLWDFPAQRKCTFSNSHRCPMAGGGVALPFHQETQEDWPALTTHGSVV